MYKKTKKIEIDDKINIARFKRSSTTDEKCDIVVNSHAPGSLSINVGSPNDNSGEIDLPFSFGFDANGNAGYRKPGADAVTPFKQKFPLMSSDVAALSTCTFQSIKFRGPRLDQFKSYAFIAESKPELLVNGVTGSIIDMSSTIDVNENDKTQQGILFRLFLKYFKCPLNRDRFVCWYFSDNSIIPILFLYKSFNHLRRPAYFIGHFEDRLLTDSDDLHNLTKLSMYVL